MSNDYGKNFSPFAYIGMASSSTAQAAGNGRVNFAVNSSADSYEESQVTTGDPEFTTDIAATFTTGSRITVNKRGLYRVDLQAVIQGTADVAGTADGPDDLELSLYKNNAALSPVCKNTQDIALLEQGGDNVGEATFYMSRVLWLEAGDYLQPYFSSGDSDDVTPTVVSIELCITEQ